MEVVNKVIAASKDPDLRLPEGIWIMSETNYYTLATQKFNGARFEDHGLDLDALPEVSVFKALIVEVAKDVWRKKHPGRERLPGNFDERFQVKVFAVEGGSVAIPIQRHYTAEEGAFSIEPPDDEFDEAVELITRSINAVDSGKRLPAGISRRVLPQFALFSDHLLPDESMTFISGRSAIAASFSPETKRLFLERIATDFEDQVELSGELRGVNLDNRTFVLRVDNDAKVTAKFSAEQEPLVTDALRQHSNSRVELEGKAIFDGGTGDIARIDVVTKFRLLSISDEVPEISRRRPIWEVADSIAKAIPKEQWDDFPEDASSNVDNQLYGTVRRSE